MSLQSLWRVQRVGLGSPRGLLCPVFKLQVSDSQGSVIRGDISPTLDEIYGHSGLRRRTLLWTQVAEVHYQMAERSLFFCLCGQQGLCFRQKANGQGQTWSQHPESSALAQGVGSLSVCVCLYVCVFCMHVRVCTFMLCGVEGVSVCGGAGCKPPVFVRVKRGRYSLFQEDTVEAERRVWASWTLWCSPTWYLTMA